jgi:RNA polymerase-binding protein DksA
MSSPADALRMLRRDLEERVAEAEAEVDEIRASRSDSTADDEHDPEGSTLSSDWSRAIGLRNAALTGLAEVDAAQQRLADGSYGTCVNCGRPIAPARLEARPAAALCIDCAR